MKLKKPQETPGNGGFVFYYIKTDTKEEVVVREGSSVSQLTKAVEQSLRNNGMAVPKNLQDIVEHQICIRQTYPKEVCWNGGIGDKIHQDWIKPFLEKQEGRLKTMGRIGRAVAGIVSKVKECGGCGGRRVYREGQNPLGRAGVINKLTGNLKLGKIETH